MRRAYQKIQTDFEEFVQAHLVEAKEEGAVKGGDKKKPVEAS